MFGTAEGNGIAICGYKPDKKSGYAGHFIGNVYISGDLDVQGAVTNAVVPFANGSLRRLYTMESPESWFEDFGEATLSDGRAEVRIDPQFAEVTAAPYQVFLTPYGETRGLYVAKRSLGSFEVRGIEIGKEELDFGYRIVAKRKDVDAPRFAEVTPPQAPNLGQERVVRARTKPPPKAQ